MYQLRFLIATPRKMSPHVFCHREFRGQRTQQDDFHPGFNTFVCPAKGDKSSQDIMLELFQSAAAHQPNSHLFPLVELFDPETHHRLKLQGNEIVLRPSDLEAAQNAVNASTEPVNDVNQVNEDIGCQINFSIVEKYEAILPGGTLNITIEGEPTVKNTAEVQGVKLLHPEAEVSLLPRDTSSTSGRYVFATIRKPLPAEVPVPPQISDPISEIASPPPLLDRIISEITANGKAQATTLATTLGVPAADIKAAVAQEGSGLQNKGGWINLIEN